MNKISNIPLFLFATVLFGCATPYHAEQSNIKLGMDKSQVLNLMDNPKYTYRNDSRDHWVYRFHKNEVEQELELVFSYGELTQKKGPISRPRLLRQAEAAQNYSEYENKVRQFQKAQKPQTN